MNSIVFPCKECLTLALCKNLCTKTMKDFEYTSVGYGRLMIIIYFKLKSKCSLLSEFNNSINNPKETSDKKYMFNSILIVHSVLDPKDENIKKVLDGQIENIEELRIS